jgi:ketopantoate reductase
MGPIDAFNVAVEARLPADVEGTYDRVFLCVKAHHTAAAMMRLAPHVATGGYVASLQNGLNADVIAPIVSPARTIAAFINFGADAPHPRRLYRQIAAETVAVASALSIQPLGFNGYRPEAFERGAPWAATEASLAEMVAHNARSAKTHSGIWRDLAIRKRQTEVDAQLGPIVRFGEQYRIDTPAIRRLIAMIHEIELGKRPLAWENLDELGQEAEV